MGPVRAPTAIKTLSLLRVRARRHLSADVAALGCGVKGVRLICDLWRVYAGQCSADRLPSADATSAAVHARG